VIDLFPGKYIHIGGDEVDKTEWKKCIKCQTRMQSEGFKDEEELQSYFIKRIEKFLISKNKKMIGWDEILEGGLAPEATVMSWRGIEGGIAAARQGHDVVMTPNVFCYFDYYQGNAELETHAIGRYLPLSKVYAFEPIPDSLTADEATHILGAQGSVWTEYISTDEHAQYMTLPRMAAMAEVVWSSKEERNWQDFTSRVENLMGHYEVHGWNYAKSAYQVSFTTILDSINKKAIVSMAVEVSSPTIHYTLDGSQPTSLSQLFTLPISITKTSVIKAGAFKDGKLVGPVTEQKCILHKASFKSVKVKNPYERYTGGGEYALTNTQRGTTSYGDNNWQGYHGKDFDAVVDLGETTQIKSISAGFLQNTSAWIFFPSEVEYSISENDTNYTVVGRFSIPIPQDQREISIKECTQDSVNCSARYIRVYAKNVSICPEWHPGKGQPAWLFIDEISVY
jgi:hexosaminidase